MKTAIIFDCEFLCCDGSPQRFWCGAEDPDPVVAQIGAVKLSLESGFALMDTFVAFVMPMDRLGCRFALDPFCTGLTGVSEENMDSKGISLQQALAALDDFSAGASFWSWGKDELNMLAISCYVAGIQPGIPAHRFDNAVKLLSTAGMPLGDLRMTPNNKLADYFGIEHRSLRSHDALDDALSLAFTLQHLLESERLVPAAFGPACQ